MLAKQGFLTTEPSHRPLENAKKYRKLLSFFYEQGNDLAFFIPAIIAMGKLSEAKEYFLPLTNLDQ